MVAATCALAASIFAIDACGGDDTDDSPGDREGGVGEGGLIADASEEKAPIRPRCGTDLDCVAPNNCYTGHCDLVLGACTYAICEQQGRACSVGVCDVPTSTCSDSQDYGMRATRYEIGGATLGCAATSPGDCFAVVYPFGFVGTKSDVTVLRIDDLRAQAFAPAKHQGDPIVPARLVPSGRRLWVLGAVQVATPTNHLTISWIDVPSDPTVNTSLAVQTTTVSWPFPDAVAFAAPDDGIFLASGDPAQGFPAARLNPPFASSPTFAVINPIDGGPPAPLPTNPMTRITAPAGAALVASSGERLVLDRGAVLNLVTSAGTRAATLGADQALVPTFLAFSAPRFAQGPDGTVLFAAPIVADQVAPDCNCTTHERLHWALPNALAPLVDVSVATDLEAYVSPRKVGGACRECVPTYVTLPSIATWIDSRTALFIGPSTANAAVPSVRAVARDPVSSTELRHFTPPATELPVGNFATDRIALASSNGFGYLLVSDAVGTNVHLSIFDPRCDAK